MRFKGKKFSMVLACSILSMGSGVGASGNRISSETYKQGQGVVNSGLPAAACRQANFALQFEDREFTDLASAILTECSDFERMGDNYQSIANFKEKVAAVITERDGVSMNKQEFVALGERLGDALKKIREASCIDLGKEPPAYYGNKIVAAIVDDPKLFELHGVGLSENEYSNHSPGRPFSRPSTLAAIFSGPEVMKCYASFYSSHARGYTVDRAVAGAEYTDLQLIAAKASEESLDALLRCRSTVGKVLRSETSNYRDLPTHPENGSPMSARDQLLQVCSRLKNGSRKAYLEEELSSTLTKRNDPLTAN